MKKKAIDGTTAAERLKPSSTHLDGKRRDESGRWLIDELDAPIIGIGALNDLDENFKQKLVEDAKEARNGV